jgi:hypothetical protein
MIALGYSRSWPTSCFINGGCGDKVFAYTGGSGDFVLFDELGPPWPVHECYLQRVPINRTATVLRIGRSRSLDFPLPADTTRPWGEISSVRPTQDQYWKEVNIVGTVVDIFDSLAEWRREFRNVYGPERLRMNDQVHRSRSVARIVTGNGEELHALFDPNQQYLKFQDLVAATLKVKPLLDEFVFFVLHAKRFRG